MDIERLASTVDRIRDEPRAEVFPFPPDAAGSSVRQIVDHGWHVVELATPHAVFDGEALAHNLAAMSSWCAARGVQLQPHGKTTMAPQLFARQLAHGATAIVAATARQVRVMRAAGVPTVALANQLTQPDVVAWVGRELAADPGFSFSCWVDSLDAVELLDSSLAGTGAAMDVLVEVGQPGGRTGCRTEEAVAEVASAVAASANLRLVGVAGYEGAVAGDRRPESVDAVRAYLQRIRATATLLAEGNSFTTNGRRILTVGGSMFFDLVADELCGLDGFDVVLRSGCYIAHDDGMFAGNTPSADWPEPLRPALSVHGTVLSVQEETAFLDVGRRDASFDQGLPIPLQRRRRDTADLLLDHARVTALNDQHAFVRLGHGEDVRVGDRVRLGISHPCTTLDKHRLIPVADASGLVTDVVVTFF